MKTQPERTRFILEHTRALPVLSLPDIRLYQADEVTPLWLMTEADMDRERLAPPFWAFAWSGGQALARYVLERPEIVTGKRVLDIACGSGLVGIAAMKADASRVLCNDIDAYAEAAVALNAGLNGVELSFTGENLLSPRLTSSLGKGDCPPELLRGAKSLLKNGAASERIDVILAGDICYEKQMSEAMLTYFAIAAAQGIDVYIGDPHRSYFPKSGLIPVATYDILTHADIEDTAVKPASVWKLGEAL